MSLLLEALKKAERAKEEAQRRARGEAGQPPTEEPQREQRPVVTRDKLPQVSPTLEIASDEIASPPPAASAERPPMELVREPPRGVPEPRAAAATAAPAAEQSRAAARKVFEAKFREPNPRMPFYITIGALAFFALGTVIYFWYQLRPATPLVNSSPPRAADAAVAAAPAAEARPAPTSAPFITAPAAIPGLPATAVSSAPVAPAAPPTPSAPPVAAVAPRAIETPVLRPQPRLARAPADPAPAIAPRTTRAAPLVPAKVQAGYAAYVAGDLSAARSEYEQALRDEPGNRDALLGLAALYVRAGRYESAEALYLRVLQADPRDPPAQAALIGLRAGRTDPLATESRVKSLLAADPGAHTLNFTLGNQLAQQSRWGEAQQEYFKAYAAEPDNADFAFNLAVSLDHLRQPKAALEYYRRAITLAEKRGGSFDVEAARARADQLGSN